MNAPPRRDDAAAGTAAPCDTGENANDHDTPAPKLPQDRHVVAVCNGAKAVEFGRYRTRDIAADVAAKLRRRGMDARVLSP